MVWLWSDMMMESDQLIEEETRVSGTGAYHFFNTHSDRFTAGMNFTDFIEQLAGASNINDTVFLAPHSVLLDKVREALNPHQIARVGKVEDANTELTRVSSHLGKDYGVLIPEPCLDDHASVNFYNKPISEYYTDETRQIIEGIYQRDLAEFDYAF